MRLNYNALVCSSTYITEITEHQIWWETTTTNSYLSVIAWIKKQVEAFLYDEFN